MNEQLFNLLLTVGFTAFVSTFAFIWLFDTPNGYATKRYKLIVRLIFKGRAYETLCSRHTIFVIKRKGQMALVDDSNCVKCAKKEQVC